MIFEAAMLAPWYGCACCSKFTDQSPQQSGTGIDRASGGIDRTRIQRRRNLHSPSGKKKPRNWLQKILQKFDNSKNVIARHGVINNLIAAHAYQNLTTLSTADILHELRALQNIGIMYCEGNGARSIQSNLKTLHIPVFHVVKDLSQEPSICCRLSRNPQSP